MYADLNAAGTTPADGDALSTRYRNGTSSLEHSLRRHVGNGSEARCLRLNSTTQARLDPTGPARTRTDFVGDTHVPNGVSRRPGPQKSPCGSGRVRVVEFSYYSAEHARLG